MLRRCDAASRPFYSLWSLRDETKTIKSDINEAFVALSKDINITMSVFVILETTNNKCDSTWLKTRV